MKKKLTVIDDDHDLRNLLQIALRNEGYDVTTFSNGREFLDSVADASPAELYIIDINLGGISGYEVCKQLKTIEKTKAKSVILISANPEVQQLAAEAPADDYLLKPISIKILLDKIKLSLKD
jgi:two-component system, OmpR family, phosphate regulon response regulator PhoB